MNLTSLHFGQLSFLFLFLTCSLLFSQESSNYTLLWKIDGKDLTEPSYLFGTMHVEDSRAFKFSDAVLPSLEKCKTFALEIQPDSLIYFMSNKKNIISAKDQFKAILTDEEYQRLVDRFMQLNDYSFEDSGSNDPNVILAQMIPITEKSDDKSVFVDFYLLEHAKTMQKDIAGLEDITTQLNHFENLTSEEQREFILDQLEGTLEDQKHIMNDLTEIYSEGDLTKIEETIEAWDGFNQEMKERNIVMSKSIIRLMHKNSLFSAIGTAHLPGKDGVIALLQKAGYNVTPVDANFTGVADTYKIDESKMKWFTYDDTDLGYSLEIPQAPNFTEDFPQFTLQLYHGLNSQISYLFLGYDLRNLPVIDNLDAFAEKFMITMAESYDGTVLSQAREDMDGGTLFSGVVSLKDDKIMKMQCFLKDNICYYMAAEMDASQSEDSSVDRFMKSLKVTKAKEKAAVVWRNYKNELGAFSIDIPGDPTNISKEIPNPLDLDSDPYYMNIFSVTDVKDNSFYLIRYNDMPNGYYMKNKYASFEAIEDNLEGKATLVRESKTISLEGNEGREIEILMQGKYHAIMRVYIRGNRIYLIMEQKLNETDKSSTEDAFFKSFKLLDYTPSSTKTYKPENETFEVTFYDDVKSKIDSVDYSYSKIKNSVSYYSKNPSSGGLYQINYGELQDYFKIKDPKAFYMEHMELYKDWNDSIVKQKEIKVDGKDGMSFIIQKEGNSEVKRNQIWLDNDRLFVMTGYLSAEEYQSTIADSIFNSFKNNTTNTNTFDWYMSKTDQLLSDLHSIDSLTFQRSLGAFNYYDFETNDLPKLYESLKATYADTLYANTIKENIISVFPKVHDSTTIQHLKTLYIASDDNDGLKSTIISTIPTIEEDNAIATYKELMALSPPKTAESYRWTILSPFNDSLEFAVENYKLLSSLNDYEPYRYSVLNISTRILEELPIHKNIVLEAQNELLKFAKHDLQGYKESLKDTLGNNYTYNSLIYGYLSFFNKTGLNTPLSDDFTKQVININENKWYVTQAMTARLRSHQDVNKKAIFGLMDSLYYRYNLMKAYHDIKQFKEVPKKFKETDAFAKLSLFNYLNEEDYQPDGYDILGKISMNAQEYYVFSLNYEDETDPYLATVGPIKKLSENEELQLYTVYTDWSYVEEGNWEEQAKNIILESTE